MVANASKAFKFQNVSNCLYKCLTFRIPMKNVDDGITANQNFVVVKKLWTPSKKKKRIFLDCVSKK